MKEKTKFTQLKKVFEKLHSAKGCLWDKEQTHRSLIPYLKEEANEFIDAVKKNNSGHMQEELGDILLQVILTIISCRTLAVSCTLSAALER